MLGDPKWLDVEEGQTRLYVCRPGNMPKAVRLAAHLWANLEGDKRHRGDTTATEEERIRRPTYYQPYAKGGAKRREGWLRASEPPPGMVSCGSHCPLLTDGVLPFQRGLVEGSFQVRTGYGGPEKQPHENDSGEKPGRERGAPAEEG